LVARRWRLARDLCLSGVLAWAIARALGEFVTHDSLSKSLDIVVRFGDDSPAFPQVRLAIVTAVVCAASPYLTRPTRRIGQLLVLLLALAAMYLGTGYPNDLFAAVVIGWGVAAAVHLVFGSPGGRPTSSQVGAALDELGIDVEHVQLAPAQPSERTVMLTEDLEGPLVVEVIGRDEADAQFFAKVLRSIAYKDSGDTLYMTRLQQVEHEAYSMLLARDAGATVPQVLVAGVAGPSAALLVLRQPRGARLADVDAATVTDELLDAIWHQAMCLQRSKVVHGTLNARHIVVDDGAAAIVDFAHATTARVQERGDRDLAELLTSTAEVVGEERAVGAASRALDAERFARVLPFLQTAALSHEMRGEPHRRKELNPRLDKLRELGAQAAHVDEPAVQQLYRVDKTNLLMAIGSLVAVFALLSQIGSPQELWNTLKDAEWYWLVIAFVISMSTNVAYAVALMGTVPIRLPLWPTTECQISMSFANLAVPAVGGYATQIRFLQKQGVDGASAVASGGLLSTVAGIASQVLLFLVAVALAPTSLDLGNVDLNAVLKSIVIILLVVLAGVGVVLGVSKLRQAVLPPVKRAMHTIREALRDPKRVMLLFFGNFAASILYGFCLLACIVAFGGSISYWTLLAANIFVGTIASLVPIPGGNTAVSSVGLSGFLVAAGVPESIAVAAILANQLVVSFLPAVPGWIATRDMLSRGYI
jgi:undecaprenyl-diphosphatase